MTADSAADLCTIYLPDKGWTLFSWNGSAGVWSSIDAAGNPLPVYRFTNDAVKTTAQDHDDQINALTISQGRLGCYRSYSMERGQSSQVGPSGAGSKITPTRRSAAALVRDPVLSSAYVPSSRRLTSDSSAMQAMLDSQVAISLYDTINSVLPSAESAAHLLNSVIGASASVQKSILQKTEACLQLQQQLQEFLQTVQTLSLAKLMQNPIFQTIMGVAMALITVAVALISSGICAWLGFILLAAAIAVVVAAIAVIISSVSDSQKELDALAEKFGADSPFIEFINNAKADVDNIGMWLIIFIIVGSVSAALSGLFAGLSAGGSGGMLFLNLIRSAGFTAGAAVDIINGMNKMFLSYVHEDTAIMVAYYATENAKLQEWEAESSYFTSMQERLSQAVKSIWEYIEQLYKAQSDLIKTLGEGSTAITRNIAI